MEACCDIFTKFGRDMNEYITNDHWVVVLRPKQVTLGASVLISKRHTESLADLTESELVSLGKAIKDLESRLRNCFKFEKINYLMLMMEDKHLHFHVIPRYSNTRKFAGIEWPDPGWPKAPDLKSVITAEGAIEAVRKALKE